MAVSSAFYPSSLASVVASAGNRGSADSGARPRFEKPASASFLRGSGSPRVSGLSSALILRFPPNFVRQLSTKARRNCSNIGVAQIVAASWSNGSPSFDAPRSAFSADAVVAPEAEGENSNVVGGGGLESSFVESQILAPGKPKVSPVAAKVAASLSSDGSLAVHAGERSVLF